MSIRRTPQQKKRLSYSKDRRNTYGENSKASRKNISRNKRVRARIERRTAREPLKSTSCKPDEMLVDSAERRAAMARKKSWKKHPDTPLGEVVRRKLLRRLSAKR